MLQLSQFSLAGRLGTLIFECFGREMTTEDMILAEYSATVVGMEIMRSKTEEIEEQARKSCCSDGHWYSVLFRVGSSRAHI